MRLVASAIIRNEAARYLEPWLLHLSEFCDEIRVVNDASTDATPEILERLANDCRVATWTLAEPAFDQHEGRARQYLLEWTLESQPTHVLAIDADEFIGNGKALRAVAAHGTSVAAWSLTMTEIWGVTAEALHVRMDGAWRPYDRVHLWAPPPDALTNPAWRVPGRQLACSPIPSLAHRGGFLHSLETIYHFGWADPSTRQARYDRYMSLDGGRFHARSHLQSIMFPPERIQLRDQEWPAAAWTDAVKDKLLVR